MVLEDRYQLASDPKKRIAQAAVAMIREGMTVILDSGSTTLLIAEALVRDDQYHCHHQQPARRVYPGGK